MTKTSHPFNQFGRICLAIGAVAAFATAALAGDFTTVVAWTITSALLAAAAF